jgi:hypothetical protein
MEIRTKRSPDIEPLPLLPEFQKNGLSDVMARLLVGQYAIDMAAHFNKILIEQPGDSSVRVLPE